MNQDPLLRLTRWIAAKFGSRNDILWICLIVQIVAYWAFAFLVVRNPVLVAYQKY